MEALRLFAFIMLLMYLPSRLVEAYDMSVWFHSLCPCASSQYNVQEEVGSLQVCAEIVFINGTRATVRDYNVSVSVDDSSASASARDFFLANPIITFPAGSLVGGYQCVTFNVTDDEIVEYTEYFWIELITDDPDVDINTHCSARARVNIQDSRDVITVELLESSRNVSESDGNIQICANITSGVVEGNARARYYTNQGTASGYHDFSYFRSYYIYTFSFPGGDMVGSVRCFTITIYDDNRVESEVDEYFTVVLVNYDRTVVSPTQRTIQINIKDNDVARIAMNTGAVQYIEDYRTFSVCAQTTNGAHVDIPLSFVMTTLPNTATENDYNSFMRNITFSGGTTCQTVTIYEDSTLEYDEEFTVVLSEDSDRLDIEPGRNSTVISILEDDDGITVGFQKTLYNTMETGGPLQVCAQMFVGTLERNITLTLTSTNETASTPSDYISLNTQVTFTAGQNASTGSVACALLDVVDDNVVEVDEESLVLFFTRDEPSVTTITASSATVVIRENDNDVAGSIALSSDTYDAYESDGQVSICAVVKAVALERNITVHLSSQDSTANFDDYMTFQFVPLTFMEGAVSGDQLCHTSAIYNDSILEGNEIFSVILTSSEAIGNNMTHGIVTIRADPDDFVEVRLLEDRYSISEQEALRDEMICVVITMGILETEVTVDLVFQDGTAGGNLSTSEPATNEPTTPNGLSGSGSGSGLSDSGSGSGLTTTEPTTTEPSTTEPTTTEPSTTEPTTTEPTTTEETDDPDNIHEVDYVKDFPGPLVRLTFLSGHTVDDQRCTTITAVDDSLVEDEETFSVSLSSPLSDSGVVRFVASHESATITIVQDPNDVVLVELLDTSISGAEGEDVTVCTQLFYSSGGLRRPISATAMILNGTAFGGIDFISSATDSQLLTFPPNSRSGQVQCFNVSLLLDIYFEEPENFLVELVTSDSAVSVGQNIAIVTIVNVPILSALSVSFLEEEYNVTESANATVELCVGIISGTVFTSTAVVSVQTQTLTATSGDFIPYNTSLTFTSGETVGNSRCFLVHVLDDFAVESTETFSVRLLSSDGLTQIINITSATIAIFEDNNDFVTVGLTQPNITVRENETFPVCAELISGAIERDIFVGLLVSNNTVIQEVDYIGPRPSMLTFTSGTAVGETQCANITVVDNFILDSDRNFTVILTGAEEEGDAVQINSDASSISIYVAIDLNDLIIVGLSSMSYSVTEAPNTVISVCVAILLGTAGRDVTVNISTLESPSASDINATPILDFTPISEVLTFTGGQGNGDSTCVDIGVIQDIYVEEMEVFEVVLLPNLDDPLSAIIMAGRDRALVTISDGEQYRDVTVQPSAVDIAVSENDPQVMLCIELATGNLERDVAINLQTVSSPSSSATPSKDFTPFNHNVTFTSGQNATGDNQQCVFISLIDDSMLETNETFDVVLSALDSDVVNITNPVITVTIHEDPNDTVEIALLPLNNPVSENETLTICVTIAAGSLGINISVPLLVEETTARKDTDFLGPSPPVLTFNAGESSGDTQCAEIMILDDHIPQPQRNFSVSIGNMISIGDGVDGSERIHDVGGSVLIKIDIDTSDLIQVGLANTMLFAMEGHMAQVSVCVIVEFGSPSSNTTLLLVTSNTVTSTAFPFLDYTPISQTVTLTVGQSVGDTLCTAITIIEDVYVENQEKFEVLLLPTPEDSYKVLIVPGKAKAVVFISDGENNRNVIIQPSAVEVAVSENDPQVILCIELATGNLERDIAINLQTVSSPSSSATPLKDFTPFNHNVTFTSGQNATGDNQQCVFISLIDDSMLETNETFEVALTALDSDVVNITNPVITVTIHEDPNDTVEIALLPLNNPVSENETLTICVTITAGFLGINISVPLLIEEITAQKGTDFLGPSPPVLTFNARESSGGIQCAEIMILDDRIPQPQRNFSISIGNMINIADGVDVSERIHDVGGSVLVNIDIDTSDLIQVGLANMMLFTMEGHMAQVSVCVKVELGSLSSNTTLLLVTSDTEASTAIPFSDYTPISQMVTLTVGQSVGDTVCTAITIIEDVYVENQEKFEVLLLPTPEDSYKVLIVPGKAKAVVFISDGENNRNVVIMPTTPEVIAVEGNCTYDLGSTCDSLTSLVRVCTELTSGNLQRNVSLKVTTSSASVSSHAIATVSEDYLPLDATITFISGQSATGDNQQCFYITLLNDNILEDTERFEIQIEPINEDIDVVNITNQRIAVLINEDAKDNVRVGFTDNRFTVTESVDTAIVVCAELQEGMLQRNIKLHIETNNSSAVAGIDFQISPPFITFLTGQFGFDGVERCFTVSILDDDDTENHEVLSIMLVPEDSDRGAVVIPSMHAVTTVNIIEDPSDGVQLSPVPSVVTVTETEDAMVCIGISSGSLQREIHVVLKTINHNTSSAIAGEDFTDIVATVVISSSEPVCTNITILNDDILEDCEAFFVGFEVIAAFSGIANIPRENDKAIVIIEDDYLDFPDPCSVMPCGPNADCIRTESNTTRSPHFICVYNYSNTDCNGTLPAVDFFQEHAKSIIPIIGTVGGIVLLLLIGCVYGYCRVCLKMITTGDKTKGTLKYNMAKPWKGYSNMNYTNKSTIM